MVTDRQILADAIRDLALREGLGARLALFQLVLRYVVGERGSLA